MKKQQKLLFNKIKIINMSLTQKQLQLDSKTFLLLF